MNGNAQLAFLDKILALRKQVWPDFIRMPDETVSKIYSLFPDFQISLVNSDNEVIGIANALPLHWNSALQALPAEGVSWAIHTGILEHENRHLANTLCAISITVEKSYRNKGISKRLLEHLKHISSTKKFSKMIVPVRPNLKNVYPLSSIDDYIHWKNKEGVIFDPWLRTHIQLGAEIIGVCHDSARVIASIDQWEQWTGIAFPSEGEYVIKNGLTPLQIDVKNNRGTYIEPNIWVAYRFNNTEISE